MQTTNAITFPFILLTFMRSIGSSELREVRWVILESLSQHVAAGGDNDREGATRNAGRQAAVLGLGYDLPIEEEDGIWAGR